ISPININIHQSNICNKIWRTFQDAVCGLFYMPLPINRAFIVQSLTFIAHFAIFIYASDWFGREVMQGTPIGDQTQIDKYNMGVRYCNFGLSLMSFFSIFLSFIIAKLSKTYNQGHIWFVCLIIYR